MNYTLSNHAKERMQRWQISREILEATLLDRKGMFTIRVQNFFIRESSLGEQGNHTCFGFWSMNPNTTKNHYDLPYFTIQEIRTMNAEYSYDHDVDILTIRLGDGEFEDGAEIAAGLVAAYDRDGTLLELELRNVRRIADADFDSRQLKIAA